MEARNRTLTEWFRRIATGQILLPRFQRHEAWGHREVSSAIEAVLRQLPIGATLILEIGDEHLFESRLMVGAPSPTERANEYLLDGQQRLTALWRALHDDYEERTYFVGFQHDEETGAEEIYISGQARYQKNGQRFPLWADRPEQVHTRGLIPLSLIRPGDLGDEIPAWCDAATCNDLMAGRELERKISGLRQIVASYNVPFLSLPIGTRRDVALDVFVKLNTTAVSLTPFDIVVAQLEGEAGESLHHLLSELTDAVPQLSCYLEPSGLILDVAAFRENRSPTQASYFRLDLKKLAEEWGKLVEGVRWAIEFLEEESIFDSQRLPTSAVHTCAGCAARASSDCSRRAGQCEHPAAEVPLEGFLDQKI